jgi:hypothetical protein
MKEKFEKKNDVINTVSFDQFMQNINKDDLGKESLNSNSENKV